MGVAERWRESRAAQRIGNPEPLTSVLQGLRRRPKRISPVWFYDDTGSRLFEEICHQPEYYLARTELGILQQNRTDIAGALGPGVALIEPGSGSSLKTRMLLASMERPEAYVPVDVSNEQLQWSAVALRAKFPDLPVLPVCADFTRPFALPMAADLKNRAVYFPGSTIGNFDRGDAVRLLGRLRVLARSGPLLLGIDLVKEESLLLRAYDDAAGVTAAFNLNALSHLNRRLGANFDLQEFAHRAVWNRAESRIEMHLVSRQAQLVRVGHELIAFDSGEAVVSEYSHKYTICSFGSLAREAGWQIDRAWVDAREWFAVLLMRPFVR